MEDNALEFLFAGFAVFWAALFVYLLLLQLRLRAVQCEVETLEARLAEYEGPSEPASGRSGADAASPTPSPAASSSAEA